MEITPLDPYLALAAAQAARQLPFPVSNPQFDQETSKAAAAAVIPAPAAQTDIFGTLLKLDSPLAGPGSQVTSTTASPALDLTLDQTQPLAAVLTSLNTAAAGTPLLADPFGTLLQQAYLSPLASQIRANPVQDTGLMSDEMAQRDVVAPTAVSATQAFGGGQSSNPNRQTPEPGQTLAALSAGGSVENYLLVQRLQNVESTFGALDLLA